MKLSLPMHKPPITNDTSGSCAKRTYKKVTYAMLDPLVPPGSPGSSSFRRQGLTCYFIVSCVSPLHIAHSIAVGWRTACTCSSISHVAMCGASLPLRYISLQVWTLLVSSQSSITTKYLHTGGFLGRHK